MTDKISTLFVYKVTFLGASLLTMCLLTRTSRSVRGARSTGTLTRTARVPIARDHLHHHDRSQWRRGLNLPMVEPSLPQPPNIGAE